MPYSVHLKRGKDEKRHLNDSHLQSFHWLVYSAAQRGLFCKYCSLFLVTKPITKFAKLLGKDGDLTVHDTSQYHHDAVEAGKSFLRAYHSPHKSMNNRSNEQRMKQCLHSICALTLPLSRLFQKKTLDLGGVYGHVSDLLDVLAKRRETCDEEFALAFEQVKELSDKIQLAVKVPRIAQRQVHRNNSPHTTPEVYYRHVVFIPILDSVISD
ncbi:hypothetical protein QYM36_008094 [Artemia franciscana]|uniref:Uncharacterized protein n=1 Tax=Artemia franciscana TaxID=6661 RepID=A0AA88LEE0_ARTSF|nr:hypothetical protein QYM36_008094 [Artemia franciscana]